MKTEHEEHLARHTPGPWRFIPDDGTGTLPAVLANQVTAAGNFYVCQCNVEADARLIAAAPDLLAECKRLLWLLDNARVPGEITQTPEAIEQLRAVVAQAERGTA